MAVITRIEDARSYRIVDPSGKGPGTRVALQAGKTRFCVSRLRFTELDYCRSRHASAPLWNRLAHPGFNHLSTGSFCFESMRFHHAYEFQLHRIGAASTPSFAAPREHAWNRHPTKRLNATSTENLKWMMPPALPQRRFRVELSSKRLTWCAR